MFLLYHSDGCNTSETVFHWCYVNDLHTTHAVVCWVTTPVLGDASLSVRVVDFANKLSCLILLVSLCLSVLLTWFILMYGVRLPSLQREAITTMFYLSLTSPATFLALLYDSQIYR
jgi:hypothetical protein